MLITLIILTWNRYQFLDRCLSSLFANLSGSCEYEILIMDNGSTDKTGEILNGLENRGMSCVRVIRNLSNKGLNAYKRLFGMAHGDYIIEIDDDILSFPKDFDQTMIDYMNVYSDYGFLALNVIQDEHTNGAKPDSSFYTEDIRGDMVVEKGPTGGWCSCFRKRDYRKIRFFFNLIPLNMKRCEDGTLAALFRFILRLHAGLIKNAVCLHACGPYYAKLYGQTDREIEKYMTAGLTEIAKNYRPADNKPSPSSATCPRETH